ncbi:TIGR02677 family protein [Gandjariella thermophila]|uniref:TIGR02677 family protein n=1 Tax=Gandjariella thermophila TaxID=1931992 RepID=A0A4D4J668_9PSEU|nr:TIGR02677 family protein [Gandjariella thermophila]GDY30079.1 TIGR02677 family protein [Gandjariella thermophila]
MPEHQYQTFAHLTTPNAELYRQVMGVLMQAKRRFVVHLRPEDVHEALVAECPDGVAAPDLRTVTDALNNLEEWGNLRADPDTSRVTTVEDFHRARFLYQLTSAGEAVEKALAAYDEALGKRGALQAVALADIVTQLRALLELATVAAPDPAKTHLLLRGLVDRFTDLAGNAQAFMGSLQRTIDLHDADVDAFRSYKDRLIDYLERFVKDLVTTGAEIATLLHRIEESGVDRLLALAARREAEDAAPGAGDGEADDPRAVAFAQGLASWRERWGGLRQWFVSEPNHPSQAKLLRSRARAAIPQLLQVVASLNERRAGRSDRSADFRTLARWFAQAPDTDAMHQLWRAAFGLSSARHLTTNGDTLAEETENPVPPSTPWAQAPPVVISPILKRTGSYERRGRPNRIVDRAEHRRLLAERAAQQAAQTAEARARLVTTHPTRLRDIGELDATAFDLFLQLLGDALAARRPGQRAVTTATADGTLEVRLTVLEGGGTAQIRTPAGVFGGPDHLIEIVDLAADSVEERSA